MVAALGLARAPAFVRTPARAAFCFASAPLARVLARFDGRVALDGPAGAASAALEELGARWSREGEAPDAGPLLVVANHPGAYDALVLLAAIGRRDVAIVAADRTFLRALPGLSKHLVFVPEGQDAALARVAALRSALRHLASGGVLLHFGAGRIEPDPAFTPPGAPAPLEAWAAGTGALTRGAAGARGMVVAAIVQGVHSTRAKRLVWTRLAERHGVTTLAPLLQVALPAYREVRARVRFSAAAGARALAGGLDDAAITARVRSMALELLVRPHG
jgi:hypothetical protein